MFHETRMEKFNGWTYPGEERLTASSLVRWRYGNRFARALLCRVRNESSPAVWPRE